MKNLMLIYNILNAFLTAPQNFKRTLDNDSHIITVVALAWTVRAAVTHASRH